MTIKRVALMMIIASASLLVFLINKNSQIFASFLPVERIIEPSVVQEVVEPGLYTQYIANPCLNPVNIPDSELHWTYIPSSASELATNVDYYFLAGQLIKSGAVDASRCPTNGLSGTDYPNACGMSLAEDLVYEIQNAYDDAILAAWEVVGTPPVLLKQLIRYESQFWPGRWGLYHWGLGHVTYMGGQTGLLWNNTLYKEICTYAYDGDCGEVFIDDTMVYALLGLMDAECPTCEKRIDFDKANQSVHYLSETLLGYCYQSSQVIYNITGRSAAEVVDYATIWKLTLYDYNVGSTCLYNTVERVYKDVPDDQKSTITLSWDDFDEYSLNSYCQRGINYAEQITAKEYNFPPNK